MQPKMFKELDYIDKSDQLLIKGHFKKLLKFAKFQRRKERFSKLDLESSGIFIF